MAEQITFGRALLADETDRIRQNTTREWPRLQVDFAHAMVVDLGETNQALDDYPGPVILSNPGEPRKSAVFFGKTDQNERLFLRLGLSMTNKKTLMQAVAYVQPANKKFNTKNIDVSELELSPYFKMVFPKLQQLGVLDRNNAKTAPTRKKVATCFALCQVFYDGRFDRAADDDATEEGGGGWANEAALLAHIEKIASPLVGNWKMLVPSHAPVVVVHGASGSQVETASD